MGLDMYLYQQKPVHPNEKGAPEMTREGELSTISRDCPTSELRTFGSWRKANHIHRWFVEQVQGGEDDCAEYVVSRAQLEALLDVVQTVLNYSELVPGEVSCGYTRGQGRTVTHYRDGSLMKNPSIAKELLPTMCGFFFGSDAYDDQYVADLHETESIIKSALSSPTGVEFTYRSSW